MIAKLLLFVLKSSFLIVNATLLVGISLMGCAGGKKSKSDTNSPPPTANQDDVTTIKKESKRHQNSTTSTEKEPPRQQSTSSTPSLPKSQPASNAKTPDNKTPDNKTPDKKGKSELKLDKTQRLASKESLRPPPRTIRKAPSLSKETQKTLKDVKEFSAREAPILGEKSVNQQDFDDYLNNLGGNNN